MRRGDQFRRVGQARMLMPAVVEWGGTVPSAFSWLGRAIRLVDANRWWRRVASLSYWHGRAKLWWMVVDRSDQKRAVQSVVSYNLILVKLKSSSCAYLTCLHFINLPPRHCPLKRGRRTAEGRFIYVRVT